MDNRKVKVAFFDFCETLVDLQTADSFVDFVRHLIQSKRMNALERMAKLLIRIRMFAVIKKCFPKNSFQKRFKLMQLRGLSESVLKDYASLYYQRKIRTALIPQVLDELKKLQSQGVVIVIVSGGYSLYIKFFQEEFGVSHIIATDIEFDKKRVCTGRILGKDCLYDNKITKINQAFNGKLDVLELEKSYSDSITDLPLLKFAKAGIVVSKSKTQIWPLEYGFEELIWSKEAT